MQLLTNKLTDKGCAGDSSRTTCKARQPWCYILHSHLRHCFLHRQGGAACFPSACQPCICRVVVCKPLLTNTDYCDTQSMARFQKINRKQSDHHCTCHMQPTRPGPGSRASSSALQQDTPANRSREVYCESLCSIGRGLMCATGPHRATRTPCRR